MHYAAALSYDKTPEALLTAPIYLSFLKEHAKHTSYSHLFKELVKRANTDPITRDFLSYHHEYSTYLASDSRYNILAGEGPQKNDLLRINLKVFFTREHCRQFCGGCFLNSSLSITSRIMTKLMAWRNTEIRIFTDEMIHIAKGAITEVLLPVLTVAAVVESVASVLLYGIGLALKHISDTPLSWSDGLDSSLFTIRWTVNMLYHNLYNSKLPVSEYEARKFIGKGLKLIPEL